MIRFSSKLNEHLREQLNQNVTEIKNMVPDINIEIKRRKLMDLKLRIDTALKSIHTLEISYDWLNSYEIEYEY